MTKKSDGAHAAALGALGTVLNALDPLGETDQQWVIDSAAVRLGLRQTAAPAGGIGASSGPVTESADQSDTGGQVESADPKEFLKFRMPQSDVQRAACLGYFLTKFRDTPEFKTRDITDLNTAAGGLPISNPSRTVDNATKQNGYFITAGKGKKKMSHLGETVVEALPDQEKVKEAVATFKPKRRTATRKTKARKARGS